MSSPIISIDPDTLQSDTTAQGGGANPANLSQNFDPITGLPITNTGMQNLSTALSQAYSSSVSLQTLFAQLKESPIAMLGLGLIVASVFVPDLFGGGNSSSGSRRKGK